MIVLIFHALLFIGLKGNYFYRIYPPPAPKGIELVFEREPEQGFRRNPVQKPVVNPDIVNEPGNSAPQSAQVAHSNQSTKPQAQPDVKPSDLPEDGDVEKPAETPVNQRALFHSSNEGDKEANKPASLSDDNNSAGVGHENTATRTADTPLGPSHRQMVTVDLAGRSQVGELPKPAYTTNKQGRVVVEITVDRDGRVVKAAAQTKGSTTQDGELRRKAEEAARRAKFNVKKDAPLFQTGRIIYDFKLN
ncbi:MAG: TonB family protein [Prevotellaceae bacterium]|nr:TonB family protein [Prevotellaceae bacterium]